MSRLKAALDGIGLVVDLVRGAIEARRLDKQEKLRRVRDRVDANKSRDDELRRKARGQA